MTAPTTPTPEQVAEAKDALTDWLSWHDYKPAYWVKIILSALSGAQEDSRRMDLAQELLIGADFAWGDPDNPTSIVAIEMPTGTRIGTDFREFLDNALAVTNQGETHG